MEKRRQTKLEFRIQGMDCAEEVAVLKREVGPVVGGDERLSFDILKGRMTVSETEPDLEETVIRAVNRTGMRAQPWEEATGKVERTAWRKRRFATLSLAASGLCLALGFLLQVLITGGLGSGRPGLGHQVPPAAQIVYLVGILAAGSRVLPKAWLSLLRRRPDMNLLMSVAVAGAVGIGEWFEAATVAFLFALSLALESWSVGRARRAVEALMDLAAPMARLVAEDGRETEVAPDQVSIGSRFVVKPGERIPLDGLVRKGSSQVNQAPITGESLPVAKETGAEVYAGTINGDGVLEVESTREAADSTLAHIIRMVGEAQAKRASSERWVEKFAAVYTPAIIALAVVVVLAPPLLFQADWATWLYRSLVLLVIGCPCALVISTPVSVVSALAAAARNGVLVKGGVYIETPAALAAIAFDKTGTLTRGEPSVIEVVALSGHDQRQVLERAAALEMRSNHPIARAIVRRADELGHSARPAEDFQALQGKGATGTIGRKPFWIGSHRFLEERGQETEAVHDLLNRFSKDGATVVVVGDDQRVWGLIALADSIRVEARKTVSDLRAAGVRHLAMLTGDSYPTAHRVAEAARLDEVRAELLPEEKVAAVAELVARHGRVAMVGDGVNDAPAMARASLGIAMGAAGSDAAIEAADVALMADDLSRLPWLILHSRRTLRIIRQNVALSIGIKVVFVALTLVGHASLWAAIAGDMGVSLLVTFNALRLLRGD